MIDRTSEANRHGSPNSQTHEGGCLCGQVRYRTVAEPVRVTICHCTFCQRLTGSAFLVEPIFKKEDIVFSGIAPRVYHHQSDTSGKRVSINFCGRCGTTLYLDLERFPDILGVCGGTFDDPNWFDRSSAKCRHIFTRSSPSTTLHGTNSASLMSANGMVRPCSCPASAESGKGLRRQRSTPCPRTSTAQLP
jgi:hypothetical protein